jgi:hypothetical protein
MKHTKILMPFDEQDCMPNHGEINIQIIKNLLTWDYVKIFFWNIFYYI